MLAAIGIVVDIIVHAGIFGFDCNLADGFLDGKLPASAGAHAAVIDGMNTGCVGIHKVLVAVGGVEVAGNTKGEGIAGGGYHGVGEGQLGGVVADVTSTSPTGGDVLVGVVFF